MEVKTIVTLVTTVTVVTVMTVLTVVTVLKVVTVVTVVTTVTILTVLTVVTANRNKHVCKTLHQFVSAIGITNDSVGHGSELCRPILGNIRVAE